MSSRPSDLDLTTTTTKPSWLTPYSSVNVMTRSLPGSPKHEGFGGDGEDGESPIIYSYRRAHTAPVPTASPQPQQVYPGTRARRHGVIVPPKLHSPDTSRESSLGRVDKPGQNDPRSLGSDPGLAGSRSDRSVGGQTIEQRLEERRRFFHDLTSGERQQEEGAEGRNQPGPFAELHEAQRHSGRSRSRTHPPPTAPALPRTREEFFADMMAEKGPPPGVDRRWSRASGHSGYSTPDSLPDTRSSTHGSHSPGHRRTMSDSWHQFFSDWYKNYEKSQQPKPDRLDSPKRSRSPPAGHASPRRTDLLRKISSPDYPAFREEEELPDDSRESPGIRAINRALNEPMTDLDTGGTGVGVELRVSPPSPVTAARSAIPYIHQDPRDLLNVPHLRARAKKLSRSHSNPEYAARFLASLHAQRCPEIQQATPITEHDGQAPPTKTTVKKRKGKKVARSKSWHQGAHKRPGVDVVSPGGMSGTCSLRDLEHHWCYLYWLGHPER